MLSFLKKDIFAYPISITLLVFKSMATNDRLHYGPELVMHTATGYHILQILIPPRFCKEKGILYDT